MYLIIQIYEDVWKLLFADGYVSSSHVLKLLYCAWFGGSLVLKLNFILCYFMYAFFCNLSIVRLYAFLFANK